MNVAVSPVSASDLRRESAATGRPALSRIIAGFVVFPLAVWLAPVLPAAAGPGLDAPETFVLSDGTEVEVDPSGSFVIRNGGREVFATSTTDAPTLHRFSAEQISGGFAHYEFQRTTDEPIPLLELRSAKYRSRTDSVRLRVRSARRSGSGWPRRARGTIDISPRDPGQSTSVFFSVRIPRRQEHLGLSMAMPLRCDSEASFYGFGAQYNATDQRGEAFQLFLSEQGIGRVADPDPGLPTILNGSSHSSYFPMPYFLDARGFGVLARTNHRVEVDLCASSPETAWMEVVDKEPLELVAFHGPTAIDAIRQLGDEVGRPQAPPAWAYDLWISAQGGQQAILDEANDLRAAGVPAGVLWVQDWVGGRVGVWGNADLFYRWEVDETQYPDLPGLISDVGDLGFRFLGYACSFVDHDLQHFAPMRDQGLLIDNAQGTAPHEFLGPNAQSSLPDMTNPATVEYVKDFLRKMVTDFGMDGWMSDFGEWAPVQSARYFNGGDPMEEHNLYPLRWKKAWREVMDELRPDGDYVIFSRSGWTGMQDRTQIHWIGDQVTVWDSDDGIRTVIPALLNLGMSGVPYVTHDIAGYHSLYAPIRTKELFQRWTELGAFTPYMRTHEGEQRWTNWNWDSDADTITHFRRFANIHAALGAEFQALAATAETTSAPILRHLMLEFPDDAGSRAVDDQFLVGDSLLVAPVLDEGAVLRSVYLPPGSTWYDVWTGTPYAGGQTIVHPAPIGAPPVFSRDVDRSDLRSVP